jgi:SMC interacting uncharacterized protein involved in chromosome segregation
VQFREREQECVLLRTNNTELQQQMQTMEETHEQQLITLRASIATLEDQLTASVLSSSSPESNNTEKRKLESLAIRVETLRDRNRDLESKLGESNGTNQELLRAVQTLEEQYSSSVRNLAVTLIVAGS